MILNALKLKRQTRDDFTKALIKETRVMLDEPEAEPKRPSKLGAQKLTPEEQKRRFVEGAREAGASEDEADFDAAFKRIAKPKVPTTPK
ncbi:MULTISPECIES: hypothetical protein [unclassified Methylobacterium]|uniref:hypothetical protein n=1 Tax=unclassified Methylobacterium TaxID=2615210 RepID=UPI000B1AE23C|nr:MULTISPECIES: hypothetical protein [unclassified Methylobacterium]